MLLHTADVLVMEQRRCRMCGSVASAPSPLTHMMFHSVAGDPRKVAIVPRKPEDAHHITRTVRYVEVEIPACLPCWESSAAELTPYEQAAAFTPERPAPIILRPATPAAPPRIPSLQELI